MRKKLDDILPLPQDIPQRKKGEGKMQEAEPMEPTRETAFGKEKQEGEKEMNNWDIVRFGIALLLTVGVFYTIINGIPTDGGADYRMHRTWECQDHNETYDSNQNCCQCLKDQNFNCCWKQHWGTP